MLYSVLLNYIIKLPVSILHWQVMNRKYFAEMKFHHFGKICCSNMNDLCKSLCSEYIAFQLVFNFFHVPFTHLLTCVTFLFNFKWFCVKEEICRQIITFHNETWIFLRNNGNQVNYSNVVRQGPNKRRNMIAEWWASLLLGDDKMIQCLAKMR